MEPQNAIVFGKYLNNPDQIKKAIANLENNSFDTISFEDLYRSFERDLMIEGGDGLPITAIELEGPTVRARLNDAKWMEATNISEIGVNPEPQQGRANAKGYKIFYGANTKKTAAFEVLQGKGDGFFDVTIGIWQATQPLRLVNFVDKTDETFKKIPFAHSDHKNYLTEWPEIERKSATMIIDFFKNKFKENWTDNLYNITNVLAGFCFSLKDLDGIGYASVSDEYEGYNVALRHYDHLECVSVERWKILVINEKIVAYYKTKSGTVKESGDILWEEVAITSTTP